MKRDIQVVKDDIIEMKRLIKQTLISDSDILKVLHSDIDIDSPDEFLDTHIFGFIRIPTTQDTVRNFICFIVDDVEEHRFNEVMKTQYIQVQIFCHSDDIDTGLGISRHDLLGFFVKDILNWSNIIGIQFKLVYNRESVTDTNFSCRLLKFEAVKPNSLSKGLRKPTPRKNDEVNSHGLIVRN